MPHEIHTSERRSFRGCKRRWNWAYREGFVPEQPAKPLEFGIAFHMAMETGYHPDTWKTTTPAQKAKHAIEVFTEECNRQREQYLRVTNQTHLEQAQGDDYAERIELGVGMLNYYWLNIHPKFDDWFEPVYVEIAFEVPIEDPDRPGEILRCTNSPACGQNHSNDPNDDDSKVVYSGRIDALVKDKRYGGYLIWDHKTAAQLAANDDFLQLDDQVKGYVWALAKALGLDVRGFIYQEIRKDFPRAPQELKRKMNGRSYSTNKQAPVLYEEFVSFIKLNDGDAYAEGKYDDYIAYLKSDEAPKFHQRFTVLENENELAETAKNISLEAADMVSAQTRIYPSVGKFTCNSCAFRQPCVSVFQGEDTQYLLDTMYIQTNRRYWMDAKPDSDKGKGQ